MLFVVEVQAGEQELQAADNGREHGQHDIGMSTITTSSI